MPRFLLKVIYFALGVGAAWLFFHYILIWILPFVISFVIARLIRRPIVWLSRRFSLSQRLSALLCSLVLIFSVSGLLYLMIRRIIYEAGLLIAQLPAVIARLPSLTAGLRGKLAQFIIAAPVELQGFLTSSVDNFLERGIAIPTNLYSCVGTFISSAVLSLPKILLFLAALILGTYFIAADYEGVTGFLIRQLPAGWRDKLTKAKGQVTHTLGRWLRAQLILIGITFVLLSVGFMLLGIDYFILLGFFIALVDALPIVGVGTILIPWSVISLFTGRVTEGVAIFVIFIVTTVVHSLIEPRLISRHIGLNPLLSVLSIYVGYQIMGFWGIVLFPVAAVTLIQLSQWGYLKLWKTGDEKKQDTA